MNGLRDFPVRPLPGSVAWRAMANHMRAFPLLVLLLVACGGDPHEAAIDEMNDVYSDMISVLEGIDSKADVQAARGELQDLGKRMQEAGKRFQELGEPDSPERQAELMKHFMTSMRENQERLEAVMRKLMENPEIGEEIGKVMAEVDLG